MRNAKHLAWAYVIKHGYVAADWNYYGGRYEIKRGETEKCINEMLKNGIDWDKTKEPKDDHESEFTDTFHEPIYVDVMYGELVLQNGKTYKWGCKFERPGNVFQVVEEFMKLDSVGNVAKEKLKTWDETYL
jgi:hypothetical protein